MDTFSKRKTLWWIITGYVATIYLTIGLIGSLSLWLKQNGWQTTVSTGILALAIIICLYIVVVRLGRWSPINLLTLMAAAGMYTYIMSAFAPNPSGRIHLLEYSLLATLLFYALKFDLKSKSSFVISWVITVIVGLIDEAIQYYVPSRAYDLNDLMTNTMAATVALLVVGLVVENKE